MIQGPRCQETLRVALDKSGRAVCFSDSPSLLKERDTSRLDHTCAVVLLGRLPVCKSFSHKELDLRQRCLHLSPSPHCQETLRVALDKSGRAVCFSDSPSLLKEHDTSRLDHTCAVVLLGRLPPRESFSHKELDLRQSCFQLSPSLHCQETLRVALDESGRAVCFSDSPSLLKERDTSRLDHTCAGITQNRTFDTQTQTSEELQPQ